MRLFKSGFRTDSRQVNVDMKTFMAKPGEVEQKWYVVDVADKVLGRAATQIAMVLMGKHRPQYTPNVDTGEYVVVINAAKIRVTGNNKPAQRTYQRFSKYPGGLKSLESCFKGKYPPLIFKTCPFLSITSKGTASIFSGTNPVIDLCISAKSGYN